MVGRSSPTARVLSRQDLPSPELARLYLVELHARGLSLGQLAKLCGVGRRQVARWLADDALPTSTAARRRLVRRARIDCELPTMTPRELRECPTWRDVEQLDAIASGDAFDVEGLHPVIAAAARRMRVPAAVVVGSSKRPRAVLARALVVGVLVGRRGWTQAQAADLLQVSQAAVSRLVGRLVP